MVEVKRTVTTVARDELHTLRQERIEGDVADLAAYVNAAKPFVEQLADLGSQVNDLLREFGLPGCDDLVIHNGDHWRIAQPGERPGPGETLSSANLLLGRLAAPLSDEWWLARIAERIKFALAQFNAGFYDAAMADAFSIGRDFNSLKARKLLRPINLGKTYLKASERGAAQRRGKVAPTTPQIIGKMKELIPRHGVSGAARIVFDKHKLGRSAEANRGLWYNHRKKL